jgi:two-component system, LytTR family, sensor kinase
MNQSPPKRFGTLIFHLSAWTIYILLYATIWREPDKGFGQALIYHLLLLPPKLFLVYASLLYLVPRFLMKKKCGYFAVTLVLLSLSSAVLNQLYLHFVLKSVSVNERFWDIEMITKRLTFLNSPLLFALTFEGIKLNMQLSREKLNAELALLKNQLQPHFFFNTLNNLYSLVLQKSDLAPELILKLSGMMRYILYDSNKETVKLEEEVDFITNYIAIEKIRYGKRVKVTVDVPESLPSIQFPPLILFTFIENSFKHGVAQEIEEGWIELKLAIEEDTMIYKVKNSLPNLTSNSQMETREGIGLKNIRQRLEILYGDKHQFNCTQTATAFEAVLSVTL